MVSWPSDALHIDVFIRYWQVIRFLFIQKEKFTLKVCQAPSSSSPELQMNSTVPPFTSISAILFLLILSTGIAHAALSPDDFKPFTEASFGIEFKRFNNQKNRYFLEKYSFEENMWAEAALLAYKERLLLLIHSDLNAGMGESPYGLAIHPYDMSYGVTPAIEYRFRKLHISSGIDHRCFHYIDQEPLRPIVYWNRLFLSTGTPHRNQHPRSSAAVNDSIRQTLGKLAWNISTGFYIHEFFGIVRPINLMSLSWPHYLVDCNATAEYFFFSWKSGTLSVTENSLLGCKRNGNLYWLLETGSAARFAFSNFDFALFARFTLDGGRFNSKDQLFEFGFSFTN